MIAFQNVSFGYNRRRKVFADLSLTFGEGHIHGLLGRNGTGKSTLLQLICGLLEPDTGHIAVDGFTPRQRSVDFLSRLMLIPEELSLPNIPLRRFASHTGVFYPGYSAEMFESHCEALEIDPSQNPHDMSMGQRKKGYIAFALACNPQFLLLDEPTTGLDPNQIVEIRELIKNIGREKTVIMSSHILAEIEATCDRVLIINKGKIVADGTSAELRNKSDKGKLLKICIQGGEDEDIYNELALIPELENIISSTPHHFEIQCERATEIEKKIFDICCQNNWYISEMTPVETRLEDIFRQVTKN